MVGSNLTAKKYKEEIRKLEYNLKRRSKRIEGRKDIASQYLPEQLYKLQHEHPQKLSEMSYKELRSYYRELVRLDMAKSSRLKGAIETRKNFGHTENILKDFSDERKRKFWSLYDKVYENFLTYGLQFKYEILDYTAEIMEKLSDNHSEGAIEELMEELDNLYAQEQLDDLNDEELRDEFIQIIQQLREYYL